MRIEVSRRPLVAVLFCLFLLGWTAPAHAASAWLDGGVLRVVAGPGEPNRLELSRERFALVPGTLAVTDESGWPLHAGPGCAARPAGGEAGSGITCDPAGQIAIETGDLRDSVELHTGLPARVRGGDGNDRLLGDGAGDVLWGGLGNDELRGGAGGDLVHGGLGDDHLAGDDGNDRLRGERGSDVTDGGGGSDRIAGARDHAEDSVWCGTGRDAVRAEVIDYLAITCERVDYGPPGRVGPLLIRRGGGRFVPVPGQSGTPGRPGIRVDRRILHNVTQLIQRYRVRLNECFARDGHSSAGEHPLGLACDFEPGPGGSWRMVDRLARWAEPRPNRPRRPFKWVGYNGDAGHGRGHHLHLSWDHSSGRPFRPVRTVWAWQVR